MLEGRHTIKTGQHTAYSEQHLVDCVYPRDGCNRGNPNAALRWIKKNGLMRQSDYPYIGKYSGKCMKHGSAIKSTDPVEWYTKDPNRMKQEINNGPISALVGTHLKSMHQYNGGIYNDQECPIFVDHAVGIVGYGSNYWIIRNCWGSDWGERGYMRMAILNINHSSKGYMGMCGINNNPSYANPV
jgi:C1A family cysteine protease